MKDHLEELKEKTSSEDQNFCCGGKKKAIISDEKILYLGIDFGTTNCLISYFDLKAEKGEPELKFVQNQKTSCNFFSSVVSLDQDGKYFFCSEGLGCSSNLKITKSIKRIIGLKLSEIKKILDELSFEIDFEKSTEDDVFVFIGNDGISRSVRDIVLGMMKSLFLAVKQNSETKDFELFRAVITVPAYFDENSRIIIKEAAILAGFEVLKLINEPTAAALMYMHSFLKQNQSSDLFKKNGNYLVYDFGGGTFDISVLRSHNNDFFRVIGIGGDKYLGGDDLDLIFANFACEKSGINFASLPVFVKNQLVGKAKKFKEDFDSERLGEEACFEFYDPIFGEKKINLMINREIFDQIFDEIIEKTIKILKKTLKEINFSFEKLDGIILVGGSSRLKLIRKKLLSILESFSLQNKIKILDFFNPDEVVAAGAALYALNLNPILQNFNNISESSDQDFWQKNFKQYFIDAISQNLGIEIGAGLCEFLIPKNSPIPITAKQIFSNQIDNQKSVRISICQGESSVFKENVFLGEFLLDNLPEARAGELQIEISFSIDCDGILSVFAKLLNQIDKSHDMEQNFKSYFLKI